MDSSLLNKVNSRNFWVCLVHDPSLSVWQSLLYSFSKRWWTNHILFSLTRTTINQREVQLSWCLFAICLSYMLFVMPMVLHVIFVDLELYEDGHHGPFFGSPIGSPIFALYFLQYSLNFFIYAARSDQYRKAYLFFLTKVLEINYFLLVT